MSYTRLACRTPENIPDTPTSALPRDIPFSIAISGDEFNPWTTTSHKFRFYSQPIIESVVPEEVEVGQITEVTITAAEGSEFIQGMPLSPLDSSPSESSEEGTPSRPGSVTTLKCRFGRFGEASAIYVDSKTIKCTTPPADDPPDTIYKETVNLAVALNGQDYMEDDSATEFTFIGTAPYISFATIVMTLLAIAFVGFAGTLLAGDWYQVRHLRGAEGPSRGLRSNFKGPLR